MMSSENISEGSEEKGPQKLTIPRIGLVGMRRGLGLSSIVAGVIGALRKQQLSVGVLKVGSPLEQLAHYRRLSGRLCYSLHPWNIRMEEEIPPIVFRASSGAELLIVEGEYGLYDRLPIGYRSETNAEFLHSLKMPICAVIDAPHVREGIAAFVKGVADFDPYSNVIGVIVSGSEPGEVTERQRKALIELEEDGGPKLIGVIPRVQKELVSFSTSLPDMTGVSRTRILASVDLVERYLSLSKLRELAQLSTPLEIEPDLVATKSRVCRVAVADDAALHSMYQENLDLLRREGAELIPFSPMSDEKLPQNVRALYLPGGPIDLHAAVLSANTSMRDEIRAFAHSGGLIYAEGSGLSYLSRSITLKNGDQFEMSGVIPIHSTLMENFEEMSNHENVVECRATAPTYLIKEGESLRGIRPARWAYRLDEQIKVVFETLNIEQILRGPAYLQEYPPTVGAFMPRNNVLGCGFLLNWTTGKRVAEKFVSAAMQ